MPSRTQWIYYVICALGLALYLWAADAQMRTAALPGDFPIDTVSYPAQIFGTTAGSPAELAFLVQGLGVGRRVQITQSDGSSLDTVLVRQFSFSHRFSTYLSGLLLWAVGIIFFAPRAQQPAIRDFFWASFFYGVAIMTGGVFHPPDLKASSVLLPILRIFSIPLVMSFFVCLSLEFPHQHRVFREKKMVAGLFALPAAVALLYALVLVRYLRQPGPELWADIAIPAQLSRLVLVGYFITGGVLFYMSGSRAQRSRERAQVKWILWGIGIGAAPFVFLWTLPQMLGLGPLIKLEHTRIFAIACPLSFAVAVVRYQFLNIDVIIRRSLIYAGLAGVMVFIYTLISAWIGEIIQARFPQISRTVSIASIVVPVILFNPTRKVVGRFVDRTFFKIRGTYEKGIRLLQARLQDTVGHEDVVDVLHASLRENLHPKRSAVILRYQDQTFRSEEPEVHIPEAVFTKFMWLLESERPVATPWSTSMAELESESFPKEYRDRGYLLAMSLTAADECRGVLLLGEKESERRYLEEDVDFLTRAVALVRPALERINLVQRVAEETMARRQLDELNRLKNEFLSRVAHDLRTPLTSIRWSSQNLIDGVAGETSHNQQEYLYAIQTSANHLTRLVNNLLEISKLESGDAEITLEPIELDEIVDSALVCLRPIAGAKNVEFRRSFGAGSHRAMANQGMMLEVVNNLIENAIKFSPHGSEVEIELSRYEAWNRLAVRDQGPGIPETDREVIFERFRQGKGSSGTEQEGFGLGLYVVKSFVEAVNGKVWAENHPEGGAKFVCLMPAYSSTTGSVDEGERTDC